MDTIKDKIESSGELCIGVIFYYPDKYSKMYDSIETTINIHADTIDDIIEYLTGLCF